MRHCLQELEGMFRDREASPTEITEDGRILANVGYLLTKRSAITNGTSTAWKCQAFQHSLSESVKLNICLNTVN